MIIVRDRGGMNGMRRALILALAAANLLGAAAIAGTSIAVRGIPAHEACLCLAPGPIRPSVDCLWRRLCFMFLPDGTRQAATRKK